MLSVLIFLPLVFGVMISFIKNPRLCRIWSAIFSTVYFLLSLALFVLFDSQTEKITACGAIVLVSSLGNSIFCRFRWFVFLVCDPNSFHVACMCIFFLEFS